MAVVSLPTEPSLRVIDAIHDRPVDEWTSVSQRWQEQAACLAMSSVSRLWRASASIRVLVLAADQLEALLSGLKPAVAP